METKTVKKTKQIDLSEYSEEAIPFDMVIRKIGKANQNLPVKSKPEPKVARKRK